MAEEQSDTLPFGHNYILGNDRMVFRDVGYSCEIGHERKHVSKYILFECKLEDEELSNLAARAFEWLHTISRYCY